MSQPPKHDKAPPNMSQPPKHDKAPPNMSQPPKHDKTPPNSAPAHVSPFMYTIDSSGALSTTGCPIKYLSASLPPKQKKRDNRPPQCRMTFATQEILFKPLLC